MHASWRVVSCVRGTFKWRARSKGRRYDDRPGGRVAAFPSDDKTEVMQAYPDAVADIVVPRSWVRCEPPAPPAPREVGVHPRGVDRLGHRAFPLSRSVPDQLRAREWTPPRYSADHSLHLQNIGWITSR